MRQPAGLPWNQTPITDEQDYCSARLRELENKQRLHFMSYTT